MKLENDQVKFLKSVDEFTLKFNTISIVGKTESLYHCFWNFDKIKKSEELKEEWDISVNLIPFYGNWHDLFCLNVENNEIVYLDDDRDVLCTWSSISDFLNSLSNVEEKPMNSSGLVKCSGSFFDEL